ncbi:unnamed protein product [Sphenostylis stenocarpa]|uniref:Uncharacterized protein n=1 Tax=Sphenostylis stenocarpa TaxID=92480 RepID=A0AA86VZE2_9FABA|nr:unnamed protein product [Sphenostylis stenocarpa]
MGNCRSNPETNEPDTVSEEQLNMVEQHEDNMAHENVEETAVVWDEHSPSSTNQGNTCRIEAEKVTKKKTESRKEKEIMRTV